MSSVKSPGSRPSEPWRVTKYTSRGAMPTTSFRSQRAAYEAVVSGRRGAESGETDDVAAVVERWEGGRWGVFERVEYPQHPDRLASRYEEEREEYRMRPDAPGQLEAVYSAWQALVAQVERSGHEAVSCGCRPCAVFAATSFGGLVAGSLSGEG